MWKPAAYLAVSLLCAGGCWAQKKPITLQAIDEIESRATAVPGAPIWSPRGFTFAYRQGSSLMLYDAASKTSKQIIELEVLDDAAVKPPAPERFDWENRRVREAPIQWSPSGKDLLYLTGGDLFLIHLNQGPNQDGVAVKWDQLTKTPVAERDPKFSPDGRFISYRRNWDLYVRDLSSGCRDAT